MYFSVIIPSYNEAAHIQECIESVRTNDDTKVPYQIIIVDNGSRDGTVEIVKGLNTQIIENTEGTRKTIGTLRNLGANQTKGDILAFLDGDMIVPANWLMKAREIFDNGFVGAMGFIESTPDSAGWVGKTWGNRFYQKLDKVRDVDFLTGRNIFINRIVFEQINGFNEILETSEDKDFTLRVLQSGYQAISVPDLTVIHLGYEKSLREFIKKEFWRQGNSLLLARIWNFSFRTLRNPLVSFWHVLCLFFISLSLYFLHSHIALLFIFMWISPSLLLTIKKVNLRSPLLFLLSFYFLTFLRWNISGLSLMRQIIKK
jgi:glycosyltransferase involved in cell wall biosynthesis